MSAPTNNKRGNAAAGGEAPAKKAKQGGFSLDALLNDVEENIEELNSVYIIRPFFLSFFFVIMIITCHMME